MFDDFPFETVTELQARGILEVADGNHGNDRPRSEEFGSGDTAFIRAADMDGGRVLFESAERINDVALTRIRKGKGKPGDILFSSKGTVGKLALVQMNAPPFVCSPQTTYWRTLDENQLDRIFLYAFMQSAPFIEQWEAIKGDTDMAPYASLTSQRQFRVPLPDIKFQRNVASVFRPLDDKIALNRRMNRTLEELAAALFRSWFVDFDPVVAKAAGRQPAHLRPDVAALFPAHWQDSPLGSIPHGWRVTNLGDAIDLAYGKALKAEIRKVGTIPVFGSNGQVGWHDQRLVEGPGIVVGRKGNPGIVTWVAEDFFPIDTAFFVQRKDKTLGWQFLFHSLCSVGLDGLAADSAVPGLNRTAALQNNLLIPSKEILDAFERMTTSWWHSVRHNEQESRTLAALRDTLLPKLLSGELRVKSAEKLVEAQT